MAFSAGSVSLAVKPDTSNFGSELRSGIANSAQDLIDAGRVIGEGAGKSILGGITTHLSNAGQSLTNVGKSMSMAITAPLLAIGVAGIKSSADFGVTMASMQVNSGATATQMEELRKLSLKMGQDTVYSAGEAADAMLELSKGGMSVASIQGGALASAMNLASTEGIGLADASTIVIQAMNTFGMSAKDSGKAVDILAAGAVASTASVQDLADGLKYVGSTAAGLHVPMADTVTAMAALNNAGIDATTAGTSLNQFMLRLIPTTRKAAEEAKQLGIDFVDTSGRIKPMNEVIKELQDTYGTMGDAAKTASLKTIFGVEGMRAANILIAGGVKGWDDLSASVNKQGVAAQMAGARMSGLAGSIETMKGSIDTAMLAVGDRLDPTIRTLTGNITGLVNGFASLSPATQGAIVNFGIFAAVSGPVLIGLGKTFTGISQTITGFQGLASATMSAVGGIGNFVTGMTNASAGASAFATPMMKLGGVIRESALALVEWATQAWAYIAAQAASIAGAIRDTAVRAAQTAGMVAASVATKAAAAAQWLLNVALDANPIGLVIVAVAALVAGLVWFFTQTEIGRKAWSAFTSFLTSSMATVGKFFSDTWHNIVGWFSGAGTWLVDAGKNIIDGLINGATSMGGAVMDWVHNLGNSIMTGFKSILGIHSPSTVFHDFGANIGEGLANGIQMQVDPVTGEIRKLGAAVSENMDVIVKGVGGQLVNITDMVGQVNTAYQGFKDAGIGQTQATSLAGGGQKLQSQLDTALGQVTFTNAKTGLSSTIGGDLTTPGAEAMAKAYLAAGYTQTSGTTIVYNAAPNQSLDSAQALQAAVQRARILNQW